MEEESKGLQLLEEWGSVPWDLLHWTAQTSRKSSPQLGSKRGITVLTSECMLYLERKKESIGCVKRGSGINRELNKGGNGLIMIWTM